MDLVLCFYCSRIWSFLFILNKDKENEEHIWAFEFTEMFVMTTKRFTLWTFGAAAKFLSCNKCRWNYKSASKTPFPLLSRELFFCCCCCCLYPSVRCLYCWGRTCRCWIIICAVCCWQNGICAKCLSFFFRDLKMGKSLKVVVVAVTTPTEVGLLIYSLMRAPPCGHVDSWGGGKKVQNWWWWWWYQDASLIVYLWMLCIRHYFWFMCQTSRF